MRITLNFVKAEFDCFKKPISDNCLPDPRRSVILLERKRLIEPGTPIHPTSFTGRAITDVDREKSKFSVRKEFKGSETTKQGSEKISQEGK
jgi:hypothetical protein